jgi:hypothetical protein
VHEKQPFYDAEAKANSKRYTTLGLHSRLQFILLSFPAALS